MLKLQNCIFQLQAIFYQQAVVEADNKIAACNSISLFEINETALLWIHHENTNSTTFGILTIGKNFKKCITGPRQEFPGC